MARPNGLVVAARRQRGMICRAADLLLRAAPDLAFELPLSGLRLRERIQWLDLRLRVRARLLAAVPYADRDAG